MNSASQMVAIPSVPVDGTGNLWATASSIGASTATTVQIATTGRVKVSLCRIKVKCTAGTAASFTLRIFSKSGVTTAGDISQEYAGAATAVADLFDPGEPQSGPVPMVTDENGRLYLVFGPDAGADNSFSYMLRFYVHR